MAVILDDDKMVLIRQKLNEIMKDVHLLDSLCNDFRNALKLAIGQANSRPWTDVTDAEVEEWLQRIRTIKAAKGSTGNSSS